MKPRTKVFAWAYIALLVVLMAWMVVRESSSAVADPFFNLAVVALLGWICLLKPWGWAWYYLVVVHAVALMLGLYALLIFTLYLGFPHAISRLYPVLIPMALPLPFLFTDPPFLWPRTHTQPQDSPEAP